MTDENDDIRNMLRQQAGRIEPTDGWGRIAAQLDQRTHGSRAATRLLLAAAVLAVAVAVPLIANRAGDDEPNVVAGPGPDETPRVPAAAAGTGPIWPATTFEGLRAFERDIADGERMELVDPLAAAAAYLRDHLGDATEPLGISPEDSHNSVASVTYSIGGLGAERPPTVGTVQVARRAKDVGDYAFWYVTSVFDPRLSLTGLDYVSASAAEGPVRGTVTSTVDGKVTFTFLPIDGRPGGEQTLAVKAGAPVSLPAGYGGAAGVVLTLKLEATTSDVGVTAVRLVPSESSDDPPAEPQDTTCSGATVTDGMIRNARGADGDGVGIPSEVSDRHELIVERARTCDYDGLAALTTPTGFQFSYGVGQDPAKYWRDAEAAGEPVLRMLALTLQLMPTVREVTDREGPGTNGAERYYIWPAAAGSTDPAPEDWDALLRIYGDDQVRDWRAEKNFLGYRISIDNNGNWVSFVAGD